MNSEIIALTDDCLDKEKKKSEIYIRFLLTLPEKEHNDNEGLNKNQTKGY